MSADHDAIVHAVHAINEHWRARRYDEIGRHLADDVVLAVPHSEMRITGRDAYVDTYRDYDANAVTLDFQTATPLIDVIGDTAIARCPYRVHYQLAGAEYRESGEDLLVFARRDGRWLVVWRTMSTGLDDTTSH
jgi:ketosteroid isomerase-like protein